MAKPMDKRKSTKRRRTTRETLKRRKLPGSEEYDCVRGSSDAREFVRDAVVRRC